MVFNDYVEDMFYSEMKRRTARDYSKEENLFSSLFV